MKTKISKLLSALVVVMLLGSLTVGLAVPAAAADGAWSTLATPLAGALGNYLLVPTTGMAATNTDGGYSLTDPFVNDVGPSLLTKNKDASILYVNFNIGEGAQGSNLYKSTDGGRTWIRCSTATDDLGNVQITQIVTSPQDANRVYVVTNESDEYGDLSNQVYRSTDGGATFARMVSPVDEAGDYLPINSLAVGYNGTTHFLYMATIDDDYHGDVWMVRDVFGETWESTDFASNKPDRRVVEVFVSPNFATEALPMVGVLNTDWTDSYVTFSYGGGAWGSVAGDDVMFSEDADNLVLALVGDWPYYIPVNQSVAFPSDFDSRRSARDFFIGVTFESSSYPGGVYRIIASSAVNTEVVDDGIGVTSLAVAGNSGNCKLLAAGCNLSGYEPAYDIYHSEDNAISWNASKKCPPQVCGYSNKFLVMAPDYATSGKAWVAVAHCPWEGTAFDESGISQTLDFGVTWTDFSLLNTTISRIWNMAVSPNYSGDTTVFAAVASDPDNGTKDSIWKWDGKYWTRVMTIDKGQAEHVIIRCSPTFSADKTVFVADTDYRDIYRATDTGFWFKQQITPPDVFDGAMLVLSSTKIIVGSGANVAITSNNGTSWDVIGITGASGTVTSFDVAADGKTLLAGMSSGYVFLSTDTGLNWRQVPAGQQVASTAGALSVHFDSAYATNNMIYAAGGGSDRVYSINTATGTRWSTIDGMNVAGGAINESPLVPGIQIASDGTLYVANQTASAAGLPPAATADAFTILAVGNTTGYLSIIGGSASVATSGITITWTGNVGSWNETDGLGGSITVTQTSATLATGTFTWDLAAAGYTSAAITVDADGDATLINPSVAAPIGSFRLGEKSGTAASGSSSIAMRCLASGRTLFDSLNSGFTGTAANTKGMWYNNTANGPQIWTLESGTTSRIWTYTDRLTGKTVLTSPANNASVGRQGTATLVWTAMPTATNYQIQVGTNNTFFSGVLVDVSAGGTSYIVPGLADGITYYWRVRSAHTGLTPPGKAASQWSDTWAFTMGLGPAQWDPFIPAERVNPIPSSYNVPLRPTFMWNPADWATGYEFVLSKAADFSNPIYTFTGAAALKITAFVADKDLEYATDYYWKVTAISATSKSNTAVGSFRTLLQPVVPTTVAGPTLTVPAPVNITIPPQPAPITPTWIWAIVIIGAVLIIAVIILIVTTRRVP